MFSRFFKKASPADQREHYRRAPGKKAALGVRLVLATGEAVQGELVDVSAGGAAVRFERDMASVLALEQLVELRFTSLTRGNIKVQAVVKGLPRDASQRRYGFQFLDRGELFRQLDESFYKFFNRRRWVRAQPALDRRVRAEVAFGESAIDLDVHDLSREGVSFLMPPDVAAMIDSDTSLEVTVHIPKTDACAVFFGLVRHKTQSPTGLRVGCALEPSEGDGGKKKQKKELELLAQYLAKRIEEMDRYNSAFHGGA